MSLERMKKHNAVLVPVLALSAFIAAACSGTSSNSSKNGSSTPPKQVGSIQNAPPGANPPNQVGSPTATVTLEEFADFQCPQCAAKHPVFNEIKSMYGSRVHFIFRNFPLKIPAHDKSYEAAVAAEAAGMQGKFWDMQNMLFTNQQAWTASPSYKQIWHDYASRIGLDVEKWENDMIGIAAKSRVDQDISRGNAAGVNSTPTLFINNQNIDLSDMTVDGLKRLIDAALAQAGPAKPAVPDQSNAASAPANSNTANKK
ncbi:MAG: thioredoxin domain-containing protein [Acidobacteria bacterium]|nr:thioredoxin domain-containing protein [Acidobacteriota bacterium]